MLFALKERIADLGQESKTGTYLADCSRSDLFEIARMSRQRQVEGGSPKRCEGQGESSVGIGSAALTEALNKIQAHREMGAAIGFNYQLAHITDEHGKLVIKEWLKRHPPRKENRDETGLQAFTCRISRPGTRATGSRAGERSGSQGVVR